MTSVIRLSLTSAGCLVTNDGYFNTINPSHLDCNNLHRVSNEHCLEVDYLYQAVSSAQECDITFRKGGGH